MKQRFLDLFCFLTINIYLWHNLGSTEGPVIIQWSLFVPGTITEQTTVINLLVGPEKGRLVGPEKGRLV